MHLPRVFAFGSLAFVLAIHYGDKAQGKESPFALSSGVGFNWLDPESAHCARIAAAGCLRARESGYSNDARIARVVAEVDGARPTAEPRS